MTWFLHTFLAVIAVSLISAQNLPLLILVHYTWPTMVILCSILIADVRVTRLWIFITGTVIVITSLALEILGPELFASRHNFTSHDKLAFSLSFLAAICWGVHSAVGRRYGAITGLSNVVPFFQLTYLAVLPFYLASAAPLPWQVSGSLTWWLMLFTMASFISYVSWDFGIRHGSVIVLSLCADFIPWLSLLAAHIFLQAEIGTTTVIAAVTLVIGAITTRYGTLAKKSVPVMLEEPEII